MSRPFRALPLIVLLAATSGAEGFAFATAPIAAYDPFLRVEESYARGATVRVVLVNPGDAPVFVLRPNPCTQPISVTDAHGLPVTIEPHQMCIMMLGQPIEVGPGIEREIGTWNQDVFDGCTSDTCTPRAALEGRYEMHAMVAATRDGPFTSLRSSFWIGSPVPPSDGFIDVPETYWAWRPISELTRAGIVRGQGDGYFRPDWNITRAEVAKIALLASGTAVRTGLPNPYADLAESHSLRDPLLTAVALGFLADDGASAHPDRRATRFETLKALMDAFGRAPAPQPLLLPAFPDAPSGAEAAYSTTAKNEGLVSGNDGRFLPGDPIRRSEVSKITAHLMQLL